jgi:hypothetical protein
LDPQDQKANRVLVSQVRPETLALLALLACRVKQALLVSPEVLETQVTPVLPALE